jgi:putative glutamine amidotransferase
MNRVAITYGFEDKVAPYADALRDAGMDPVLVTPDRPLIAVSEVKGLLLSGGTDLDPALYGEAPDPRSESPEKERDELEMRLLRDALAMRIPILAICRGMQIFNVFHPGGTLAQHIEGHVLRPADASLPAHQIVTEPGTRLAEILGPGEHQVNSRHHQAVGQVGEGLIVSARSKDDRVIEALERSDRRFAIAVQWHPENQIHRFEAQRRLFLAFQDAL